MLNNLQGSMSHHQLSLYALYDVKKSIATDTSNLYPGSKSSTIFAAYYLKISLNPPCVAISGTRGRQLTVVNPTSDPFGSQG